MLSVLALASVHAVSVAGSGGLVVTSDWSPEGSNVATMPFVGARLQYDRVLGHGGFFGGIGGFERVASRDNSPHAANVGLIGGTVGGRWGDRIRGGIRLAAGFAYADVDRYRGAPGWFIDAEGEISTRAGDRAEIFLDVPILLFRKFEFSDAPFDSWFYAVPLVPTMGTVGLRFGFD
jgi:hypothetical protein